MSTSPTAETAAPAAASGESRSIGLRDLPRELAQCIPAIVALTLIVIWSEHDGGFDQDTWYWGALVLLVTLAAGGLGAFGRLRRLPAPLQLALAGLTVYTLWSYASIAWASYQGLALSGSNRTLMYLLLFASLSLMRWTPRRLGWALVAYAAGVGAIGLLMLVQMAIGKGDGSFFAGVRLSSPTGYINSSAALFMIAALISVSLSVRREVPALLRGALLAVSLADLALALLAESRGWLFTLPIVLVLAVCVSRDRLLVALASVAPLLGFAAVLRRLLDVYSSTPTFPPDQRALIAAAEQAGRATLFAAAVVFVVGAAVAMVAPLAIRWRPSAPQRVAIGAIVVVVAIVACLAAATVATHGRPVHELKVQWSGLTHPARPAVNAHASHFGTVGTERYDGWRVAWDAFRAHPIGGLGQDNFADYYDVHGRTGISVQWTHSFEMRLLAHTGIVGTLAFAVFLAGALIAALRSRFTGDRAARAVAGIALLPLIVWFVHGSIDWFWEVPALTGPAFMFLAAAGSLSSAERPVGAPQPARRWVALGGGACAVAAAAAVLVFPYLSVREMSIGSDLRTSNPDAAFAAFRRAGSLNPLNADPGRFGGTFALQLRRWREARHFYAQAIDREPDGWLPWFGSGLAASELGDRRAARHDFRVALSVENSQPAIREALRRLHSRHPLTAQQGLKMLIVST